MQKLGKDNMDVMMESIGAMTKGMQAIASEVADYQKKSFEDGTAAMEKLVAAKSLDKAFEAQSDYMKTAYEGFVGEVTKIGEMYSELAKDAYKPYEGVMAKAAK
ncbi:phasin family protein [Stappia sp.]|uniref:phasin family protein n=1 Tax=Stappia sp. TaxID=1870903 RepID=UPI0035B541ED